MRKFRKWLQDSFLPMWAKQTVLEDNRRLTAENFQLRQANKDLKSYIDGLEHGLRAGRKIIINAKDVSK